MLELAGDDAWTMKDLAAETSLQVGKSIPYRDLSTEEQFAELVSQGMLEDRAKKLVSTITSALVSER